MRQASTRAYAGVAQAVTALAAHVHVHGRCLASLRPLGARQWQSGVHTQLIHASADPLLTPTLSSTYSTLLHACTVSVTPAVALVASVSDSAASANQPSSARTANGGAPGSAVVTWPALCRASGASAPAAGAPTEYSTAAASFPRASSLSAASCAASAAPPRVVEARASLEGRKRVRPAGTGPDSSPKPVERSGQGQMRATLGTACTHVPLRLCSLLLDPTSATGQLVERGWVGGCCCGAGGVALRLAPCAKGGERRQGRRPRT